MLLTLYHFSNKARQHHHPQALIHLPTVTVVEM